MKSIFELLGQRHTVVPQHRMGGVDFRIGDTVHVVAVRTLASGEQVITIDGKPHRVRLAASGGDIFIHAGGFAWKVAAIDELAATSSGAVSDHVNAPMPGVVVAVAVEQGASVKTGDTILVIESMKLETTITATRDAVVAELPVAAGATFDKGAVLVRFAPLPDDASRASEE